MNRLCIKTSIQEMELEHPFQGGILSFFPIALQTFVQSIASNIIGFNRQIQRNFSHGGNP